MVTLNVYLNNDFCAYHDFILGVLRLIQDKSSDSSSLINAVKGKLNIDYPTSSFPYLESSLHKSRKMTSIQ